MTNMYRHVENVRDRLGDLQNHIRDAVLADNTRDISAHASAAQAVADQVLRELQESLESRDSGGARVERQFVDLAANELSMSVTEGQRVATGANVQEMRERLLRFKTHADFADAFIRCALGA